MVRTISVFVIIGFYLALMNNFTRIFLADVYYTASRSELSHGAIKDAGNHVIKAIRLNKQEPAYFRQRAKILLASIVWHEDESEIRQGVLRDLEKAERINSRNLATLRNNIPLHYFLAAEADSGNYLPVTRNYYSKLKNTYNNDLGVFVDIAKYEKKLGLEEDFYVTKGKAKTLRPEIVEWHEVFLE